MLFFSFRNCVIMWGDSGFGQDAFTERTVVLGAAVFRVSLSLSHIAGIRNTWADSLSRGDMPSGFLLQNRILLVDDLSVAAILHQPWH